MPQVSRLTLFSLSGFLVKTEGRIMSKKATNVTLLCALTIVVGVWLGFSSPEHIPGTSLIVIKIAGLFLVGTGLIILVKYHRHR